MSAFTTVTQSADALIEAANTYVSHQRAGSRPVVQETTRVALGTAAIEYATWRLADLIEAVRVHREKYREATRSRGNPEGRSCSCGRFTEFLERGLVHAR
jgi:hypothetical protein